MDIGHWRQRFRSLGAAALHEERLLRQWLNAQPLSGGRHQPEHHLPRPLREALPALEAELAALATLHSRHPAADGAERLLLRLGDGQMVESVLLAPHEGRKNGDQGLCVSTQVGCAVGCRFCMTGQGGLQRQLSSGEIVAQVVLARRLRPVRKVVFMGMGEPAHNLAAVLEAIDALGRFANIGHKNLVFSTVGDERAFEALMQQRVKPALALSLHSTKPALREALLPRAPRLTPGQLVRAGDAYARASGYPMQVQWTLLDGVNDGEDEIEGLVALLAGTRAVLNLIPYNAVDGLHYHRPSWERAAEMARTLHRRGVLTKLRHSAGQDVEGGCGQLRARAAPRGRESIVIRVSAG